MKMKRKTPLLLLLLSLLLSSKAIWADSISPQVPDNMAQIKDLTETFTEPPIDLCENEPDKLIGEEVLSREDLRCLLVGYIPASQKRFFDKTLDYLTPAFNNALIKYGIEEQGGELAIFLSQLIQESGAFKYSTEIGSLRYYTPAEKQDRNLLYDGHWKDHQFCEAHRKGTRGGERYFDNYRRRFACFNPTKYPGANVRQKRRDIMSAQAKFDPQGRWVLETAMRKNSYPSMWRGRGLIQLTHCVNYLSYAEFQAHLNHCRKKELSSDCMAYAAKNSKERFSGEVNGEGFEVSWISRKLQCTEAELKSMIRQFNKENPELDLNEGQLLTDSYNMANICKPRHMVESAAWFWKKGDRSCSAIAKGERYFGQKKLANPCRCDLSNRAGEWNGKYVRNSAGNVVYDSKGEPAQGKCVFEKKSGKCGKVDIIEKDMTKSEIARVAGASRCINGSYCHGLDHRAQYYRHVRDYLAKTPAERMSYCAKRK